MTPLIFALSVHTFVTDPAWSTGPVAGLRQVWIDPATASSALRPASEQPAGEVSTSPEAGALVFTNPTDTWAALTVAGQPVGEITAYATVRIAGSAPGWYPVELALPNGFVRRFAVRVQ